MDKLPSSNNKLLLGSLSINSVFVNNKSVAMMNIDINEIDNNDFLDIILILIRYILSYKTNKNKGKFTILLFQNYVYIIIIILNLVNIVFSKIWKPP